MKKSQLSKRNQALAAQLNSRDNLMADNFSKERILTYLSVIFLPPYALYRIWRDGSSFRRSEKWAWTMMVTVYLLYFLKLMLIG